MVRKTSYTFKSCKVRDVWYGNSDGSQVPVESCALCIVQCAWRGLIKISPRFPVPLIMFSLNQVVDLRWITRIVCPLKFCLLALMAVILLSLSEKQMSAILHRKPYNEWKYSL